MDARTYKVPAEGIVASFLQLVPGNPHIFPVAIQGMNVYYFRFQVLVAEKSLDGYDL